MCAYVVCSTKLVRQMMSIICFNTSLVYFSDSMCKQIKQENASNLRGNITGQFIMTRRTLLKNCNCN